MEHHEWAKIDAPCYSELGFASSEQEQYSASIDHNVSAGRSLKIAFMYQDIVKKLLIPSLKAKKL